jgi:pimeloyl-ACP methyl ester carboxylesterase
MPTASINGVELYYELHGEGGEPLVLVHGYTGDVTDWRHQLPEFSKTHRVLIMDHRGHGRSQAPPDRSAYSIRQMAADVEALIALAGFERYHLLGHSMGGAIAQEIALRSPGRLISLTLHDTSHRFDIGRSEIVRKFIEQRNRLAEEQGMAAIVALPSLAPPPPHMTQERKAETDLRLAGMSVDAYIGAWQGLDGWEGATERARRIAAPTMVVYGELDAKPLIDASLYLAAEIPGAVLEVVPEAAHSPQQERPEIFNAALRRHLDRNAGGAAK